MWIACGGAGGLHGARLQLHFKFNPDLKRVLAPGDRRLWLLRSLALRIEQGANPIWRVEIYHRRLLIALAGLGLAAWLLAASTLFFWLNRQPHNQVGWFDLAAPWRWPGLPAKRGDGAILAALDQLKGRDYTTAFYNLRVGLARSPGNVEGRLMLARLMAGYEPGQAITLLEEGLPLSGYDARLVGGLMGLYLTYQMQARGLGVAEGLIQAAHTQALPADTRVLVERARVGFLLQLGRKAEAEKALAVISPPDSAPARAALAAVQVDLLLHTDRALEAKAVVDRLTADSPSDPAAWRQALEVAVALGDADGVQGALRRLKAQAPGSPGVYLMGFQAWHRLKRVSFRDAAEQEYYRVFAGNDGALQALAALAVNLDLPELLTRVRRVAAANRLSTFAYDVHETELALRKGSIEEATRRLRNWENNVDTLKNQQRFYPEFIKRLTRAAFAGTPDQLTFLLGHLTAVRGQAQVPTYQLAATVLENAGAMAGAADVVQAGLKLYPQCEPLLAAQKRLAEVQASTPVTPASPATPGASLILLPATAAEARQRIDELLGQDSLVAARDLARAVRTQKPSWLAQVDGELAAREVELAYLSLDQIASRAAARGYLDRYRGEEDGLQLVAAVSRLAARSRLAEARLLQEEINASAAGVRVKQALRDLNLADDLAPATGTAEAALAALDRVILSEEWAQGERLLRSLREQPPSWLAAAATELKVREVQVRLGLDQRPLALAALKEIVIKPGAPRSAAFKLVRDLLARGEGVQALLLAREIQRLLPDDQAAARLVREAEAPRPAGP